VRVEIKQCIVMIAAAVAATLGAPGTSRAQPEEPAPGAGAASADPNAAPPVTPAQPGAAGAEERPPPPPIPPAPMTPMTPPAPPEPPHPPVLPQILIAPSARLLPAGVFYWRSGLDTGGGLSSDARIGLGDVAEFGVALTDLIRKRTMPGDTPTRIDGFVNAIFKMGVAEDRLFAGQPAVALGFRKSFERTTDSYKTRVAELYLVATKSFGARTFVHLGGVFWDAAIAHEGDPTVALHDRGRGLKDQLRPFGGVELRPLDDAQILIDVYWAPELCFGCVDDARIKLKPVLSWGVRYDLADWVQIESGVRVPDIGDANLLDAQIFGQLVFVDWRLHRAIGGK